MIPVAKIQLERGEGPSFGGDIGVMFTFENETLWHHADGVVSPWERADAKLREWQATTGDLGYDKCKYRVTWEDGEIYAGRFDLENREKMPRPSLADDIRGLLEFISGDRRPAWMNDSQWADARDRHELQAGNARLFLDTYELPVY